jgi:RND family efflux transporter MFP subunit
VEENMTEELAKNSRQLFDTKSTKDEKKLLRVLRVLRGLKKIRASACSCAVPEKQQMDLDVRKSPLRACRHGLAIVLVLFATTACGDSKNQYVAPPPPKVTVAKPEVRTVTENLEFTGNTAAYATVKLVARVQGYLEKIHFADGAPVKKGELLFTIQQDQYKAQLKQAQAEVAAAKAKLDNAITEYDRYVRLFKQKAAPETFVDQWKYTRDSSAAALENAQAQLEIARLNLSYTTVTAPFNGRMGRHLIDTGNLVGGGGQDTVLAEINRIDPMYVYFTINERDLLRVIGETEAIERQTSGKKDERAELFMGLANDKGYPRQGVVDFAAITANPQTGTLQLRGIFMNPKGDMLPGLFARIQAPFQQTQGALLVPADAVGFDQLGNYLLVVKDKNVVERKQVEIGEQVGEMRVIKSGLTGNDSVIIDGLLRAIPGREVTPQEAEKRAAAPPANGAAPKAADGSRAGGPA